LGALQVKPLMTHLAWEGVNNNNAKQHQPLASPRTEDAHGGEGR